MKAILNDVTLCVGCMRCVEACAIENGQATPGARFDRAGLSDRRHTTLAVTEEGRFVRQGCLHCLEPSCVSACLVGAMKRLDSGAVVYDADKCIGCRYCMISCPFEVPRYQWDSPLPFVTKCDLCFDREAGPACVEACPHGATIYGEREELLRIAHERIRAEPGKYVPKVWGEREMGGTAVLFLSDVSLDHLWPAKIGESSIPDLTWPLAKKTPFMALTVAGVLTATSFLIHRRNKLAAEREEGES